MKGGTASRLAHSLGMTWDKHSLGCMESLFGMYGMYGGANIVRITITLARPFSMACHSHKIIVSKFLREFCIFLQSFLLLSSLLILTLLFIQFSCLSACSSFLYLLSSLVLRFVFKSLIRKDWASSDKFQDTPRGKEAR